MLEKKLKSGRCKNRFLYIPKLNTRKTWYGYRDPGTFLEIVKISFPASSQRHHATGNKHQEIPLIRKFLFANCKLLLKDKI